MLARPFILIVSLNRKSNDLIRLVIFGGILYRYNDSADGDWILGRYPGDSGLMLATGGSGHAFKV